MVSEVTRREVSSFTQAPKEASAGENHQVRKHRWKEVIQRTLVCLVIAALVDVALINLLFYPECSRETRDCFLVQHLWGTDDRV